MATSFQYRREVKGTLTSPAFQIEPDTDRKKGSGPDTLWDYFTPLVSCLDLTINCSFVFRLRVETLENQFSCSGVLNWTLHLSQFRVKNLHRDMSHRPVVLLPLLLVYLQACVSSRRTAIKKPTSLLTNLSQLICGRQKWKQKR